ncbi:Uncharacterised protein g2822 [Pycnogonum litorale]
MKTYLIFAIVCLAAFYSVSSDSSLIRKKRWEDFPNVTMNFDCTGKYIGGYYADMENGCQIFYVCMLGPRKNVIRVPMFCQPPTLFDQRTKNCNWPKYVDCQASGQYYENNYIEYPPQIDLDSNV